MIADGIKNKTNSNLKKEAAIHGHHIVMKLGGGADSVAARKILDKYGIPLLGTEAELKKATAGQLHNICWAINTHAGIHQPAYEKEILKRLQEAVDTGGTQAEIRSSIEKALEEIRKRLEKGDVFW